LNIIQFQARLEKAIKKEFKKSHIFNQHSTFQTNPLFHTTVEIDGKQYHLNIYVLPDDVLSGNHPELTAPASWVKEIDPMYVEQGKENVT